MGHQVSKLIEFHFQNKIKSDPWMLMFLKCLIRSGGFFINKVSNFKSPESKIASNQIAQIPLSLSGLDMNFSYQLNHELVKLLHWFKLLFKIIQKRIEIFNFANEYFTGRNNKLITSFFLLFLVWLEGSAERIIKEMVVWAALDHQITLKIINSEET